MSHDFSYTDFIRILLETSQTDLIRNLENKIIDLAALLVSVTEIQKLMFILFARNSVLKIIIIQFILRLISLQRVINNSTCK